MRENSSYLFFRYDAVDQESGAYINVRLLQLSDIGGSFPPEQISSETVIVRHFLTVENVDTPDLYKHDEGELDTFTQDKLLALLIMLVKHELETIQLQEVVAYINTELENMQNESMIGNVSDMLSQNKHKYDFQDKKNRLITLMAKNTNMRDKHRTVWYYQIVLLFLVIVFIMVMGTVYIHGRRVVAVNGKNVEGIYYLLLFTGMLVLSVVVMIDIYGIFKQKHYERFEDMTSITETDLVAKIESYVGRLPDYSNLYVFLQKNLVTEHTNRKKTAESMLKDFDNENFKYMRRFQLTNYQVNRVWHNIKYIKYVFITVAVIGMMGGLNLRTRVLVNSRVVNGLPITNGAFAWISTLLVSGLLMVMGLQERQNMSRRRYNWNKMYWLINGKDAWDSPDSELANCK